MRKKVHKDMMKFIRTINKSIANDEYIGLNRFVVFSRVEDWEKYSDGSGGRLYMIIKLYDRATGNMAFFDTDNYSLSSDLFSYLNDFMIRCSSGSKGHYPALHYLAYDIHEVIPYDGRKDIPIKDFEEFVIDKYNWLNFDIFNN